MLSIDTCQLTTFFGKSQEMRPSRNPLLIRAFSAALRARRLELRLTQEELAARCELDRPFITLMEAGSKHPTMSVYWRLAEGLDLSAADLATRIDANLAQTPAPTKVAQPARRPAAKRVR
jgi:transcriptional regulator with XRE-family HTH domain